MSRTARSKDRGVRPPWVRGANAKANQTEQKDRWPIGYSHRCLAYCFRRGARVRAHDQPVVTLHKPTHSRYGFGKPVASGITESRNQLSEGGPHRVYVRDLREWRKLGL